MFSSKFNKTTKQSEREIRMKAMSGMSGIVGNIMAAHDVRMKSINDLVKGTTEMLQRFRKERADADIKGCLARGDKARLQGYNGMMSGINRSITDICNEVSSLKSKSHSMIKDFQKEHQAMAKKLKNDFAEGKEARMEGEKTRMDEFGEMMTGINKNISDIQKEVASIKSQSHSLIKDFQKEHQAMAKKQKNDFAESKDARLEGDKTRMDNFGKMMTGINKNISDIQKEVSDLSNKTQSMMKDYSNEHKQRAADWAGMEGALGRKGCACTPPVKKAEPAVLAPKPKAPAVKKATPAKVVAKVVAAKSKAPAAKKSKSSKKK